MTAQEAIMRVDQIFECRSCGSPAVSLPKTLAVTAIVRCAGCGSDLGTWQDYKNATSVALVRSGTLHSADPILLPAPTSMSSPEAWADPSYAPAGQVSGPRHRQHVLAPALVEVPLW
ncbi:hypothetical protein ASE63_24985 [Bosea sp. Root381]|nr:hypothetical protein ASE63_24985 [Bosea sp. Root381]